MGVRNCREIGENLQLIVRRLMANDNLIKLLYYSDKDPLNQPLLQKEEKEKKIFNKLISIIPRTGPREDAKSMITIRVVQASKIGSNTEFKNVQIQIEVFVPLTQWIIKDTNLRPFAILGEIQESLNGKVINGLGKIQGGDFTINYFTDEMATYEQTFWITAYD